MRYLPLLFFTLACCGGGDTLGRLTQRDPAPEDGEPDVSKPAPEMEPEQWPETQPDMPSDPDPMLPIAEPWETTLHETPRRMLPEVEYARFDGTELMIPNHGAMDGFIYPDRLEGRHYISLLMEPTRDHVALAFRKVPMNLGFSRSFQCAVLLDFSDISTPTLSEDAKYVYVRYPRPRASMIQFRAMAA